MFKEKKRNLVLILLIVFLIGITVAYATLSTNLNISGTIGVSQQNWDIHFTNFSTADKPSLTTSGETNTGDIVSVSTSNTSIDSLKAELKKPGDSIVYSFQVKNFGTIPAKLSTFNKSIVCTSDANCSYATYTVICLDGNNSTVNENYILQPNSQINCKLTLKYKDDANISDDVSATISANWNFTQY